MISKLSIKFELFNLLLFIYLTICSSVWQLVEEPMHIKFVYGRYLYELSLFIYLYLAFLCFLYFFLFFPFFSSLSSFYFLILSSLFISFLIFSSSFSFPLLFFYFFYFLFNFFLIPCIFSKLHIFKYHFPNQSRNSFSKKNADGMSEWLYDLPLYLYFSFPLLLCFIKTPIVVLLTLVSPSNVTVEGLQKPKRINVDFHL